MRQRVGGRRSFFHGTASLVALVAACANGACSRRDVPAEPAVLAAAATKPEAGRGPGASDAGDEAHVGPHAIVRPNAAIASFAVLTRAPGAKVDAAILRESIAGNVRGAICGDAHACSSVRDAIRDPRSLDVEVRKAAEWGLPKGEGLDAMTRGLAPDDVKTVTHATTVIVLTAHGATAHGASPRDAMAARVGFAAGASVALMVRGLVYDEVVHRIENAGAFAKHAITTPLGGPAWREDRIVVQLYEQEDGSARLLTLGMRRFGAPDLEIEGSSMNAGHALGALLDRLAPELAGGASQAPMDAGNGARVDLVAAPHHEGDPDNAVVRVRPIPDDGPASYDALVARVFGKAGVDGVVTSTHDAELAAVTARARAALPRAIERWSRSNKDRAGGATLLVKLPFHVTGHDGGADDGGSIEWMWVTVRRIDDKAIEGTLANTPVYVANLRNGAQVTGARADVADYLLSDGDAGTEGGESTRVLTTP